MTGGRVLLYGGRLRLILIAEVPRLPALPSPLPQACRRLPGPVGL